MFYGFIFVKPQKLNTRSSLFFLQLKCTCVLHFIKYNEYNEWKYNEWKLTHKTVLYNVILDPVVSEKYSFDNQ